MIPNSLFTLFSSLSSSSSTWQSVAPQLWNHLWQSTLFAVAIALLALALRRYPARIRYGLWIAASVKFLIPFSLLIAAGAHFAHPHPPAPSVTSAYVAIGEMSEPFTVAPAFSESLPTPEPVRTHHLSLPVLLAALWLCGFAAVLAVWLIQWHRIANSIRRATFLRDGRVATTLRRVEQLARVSRPIRLLSSPGSMEPGVFGILHPVLLWPEAIAPHLDDAHLEAVLAHEAFHVRRRDNLTALVHMLVEAIFWFHPLVWWMESQLVKERERACDEEVLLLCNRPQAYAESILKVCEFCVESPLKCVSGITGADLKKRIVQIMTNHVVRQLGVGAKCLLLIVALTALAVPFALGQVKAARTMMLTALQSAPNSVRTAASAMIAKTDAPPDTPPAEEAQATPDADSVVEDAGNDPAFEVAVIRPTNPNNDKQWIGVKVTPSGRVSVSCESVQGLAYFAYIAHLGSPQGGQVVGGPKWVDSDQFDIEAKVDDAQMVGWDKLSDVERTQHIKPMMRRLLVDRFQLKLHAETRITPVYALVQAKGGAKLKEVAPPSPNENTDEIEKRLKSNNGVGQPPAGGYTFSAQGWVAHAVLIQAILGQIAYETGLEDRPAVDETGLKGYYDFTANISRDKDGPSGETQIEEQLGLKLEPRKVPMKTYIIDSAEKPSLDGSTDGSAAQNAPLPGTPKSATAPAKPPEFEVVSLKPSDPKAMHYMGVKLSPDRISMNFETLTGLICMAYNIPSWELSGTEPWMARDIYDPKDHFDFEAKLPQDLGPYDLRHANHDIADARIREMMQAMLADRFHLKFHRETATGTVSLLERNGKPLLLVPSTLKYAKNYGEGYSEVGGVVEGKGVGLYNTSIPQLATFLSAALLHHPVVDKTGLDGNYDFTSTTTIATKEDIESGNAMQLYLPAVNEMGLKLTQAKGPVEKFVIDHAEHPSEN